MSTQDGRAVFARELHVSRETLARFACWQALLQEWSGSVNLVARSTLEQFWIRHALDGAQLAALAPDGAQRWIDLGSGAGFPGLAVALLRMDKDPVDMVLVESNSKKVSFLRTVIARTRAPVQVICDRAENYAQTRPDAPCDVISARALAPLSKLLALSAPFCGPDTVRLFPKGESVLKELQEARKCWALQAEILPSCTCNNAAILRIGNANRV